MFDSRVLGARGAVLLTFAALGLAAPAAGQGFEPGPRSLFEADFEAGSLPAEVTVIGGDIAPARHAGEGVLRATSNAVVEITLPEALPERFTVEVDGLIQWGYAHPVEIRVPLPGDPKVGYRVPDAVRERAVVRCSSVGSGAVSAAFPDLVKQKWEETEGETPCHVMVQGDRVQIYFGDARIADQKPVDLGRGNRIQIAIPAAPNGREAFIRRIRVGTHPPDMYGQIQRSGRFTAEGIYFDSGSDRIRAESRPVLEQIAGMLREHPDLKLSIEGHTDNVGSDAANRALSERRAAAVRVWLVERAGIEEGRLTAAGFGASRPVAPNTDAAGRQKNRRVELVRQ